MASVITPKTKRSKVKKANPTSTTESQRTFWRNLKRGKSNCAIAGVVPTPAYDTYWRFAAERQAVFHRRAEGQVGPWTNDPILQTYKFTNAYRASDRVSQYLIREVICPGIQSAEELFFRILLFKTFNKIETWNRFCEEFGTPKASEFDVESYNNLLSTVIDGKNRIYSAAYIMPSGGKAYPGRKHSAHLNLLRRMLDEGLPQRIAESSSVEEAYNLLLSYPMIGPFLAYQYVTDLNYSDLTGFSEMDFVVPGPGALDGISKCFSSLGPYSESEIIRQVCENQEEEFDRLGIDFQSLWGRQLQLIDCQNLFCEISKYCRVKHPEIEGIAKRTKIKQKFSSKNEPICYWFPPKWGINDNIELNVSSPLSVQQSFPYEPKTISSRGSQD